MDPWNEPQMEEYIDKEPFDLEKSATAISVKKRVGKDGRMEVSARFPLGPTPLYFGPPFTFDSSEFCFFFFFFFFFLFFCVLKFFQQLFELSFKFKQTFSFSHFPFSRMSWSFKTRTHKNNCWICGLVPIGKKDYRGPLTPGKLICLEEEKDAIVVTPNYESASGRSRNIPREKEMDFHEKDIEVCFEHFLFFLSLFF